MSKKKRILELHKLGFTNKEIKNKTNFPLSTIRWAINSEKLSANKYTQVNFNSTFFEFILGSMLGDGSISNKRFSEAHSIKQEEYCRYKHKVLLDYKLAGKLLFNRIKSERYREGYYDEVRFHSISHSIFEELRNLYYVDGIKKVPSDDYLRTYLTPYSLSIWFQDDGNALLSNLQFNTQGFSLADINKLRYIILEKFGIKTTVNIDKVITIRADSVPYFYSLISPYILKSMRYKILPTRVLNKQGELLETPEEDNQQPSIEGDFYEGSTTSRRETSLNEESVISTTSALQFISSKNINSEYTKMVDEEFWNLID
jgi:hypothetical protein